MKKSLTNKVSRKMTKLEKKKNRVQKFLAIMIGASVPVFVFVWICMYLSTHTVIMRSPIILQSMFVVASKEVKKPVIQSPLPQVQAADHIKLNVTLTKTPETEEQKVKASKYGKELWIMYQLETQRGKTDWCRIRGQGFGGFGVKVDKNTIACYATFDIAIDRANYWFGERNPEENLVDALCVWNMGFNRIKDAEGKDIIIPHTNCNYYQDYLKIELKESK